MGNAHIQESTTHTEHTQSTQVDSRHTYTTFADSKNEVQDPRQDKVLI